MNQWKHGSDRSNHVNEYANCMFRFECLNDAWIASCTSYVESLFGSPIRGKTVVDYAFGRGNWSLAFRRAGAGEVIAIDASQDNVARFRKYVAKHRVTGVRVIHGDVLRGGLPVRGDMIWLYGILHHIEDEVAFLHKVREMAAGPDALFLIYGYDADSLREFTVESCRRLLTYRSEEDYVRDSYLFTPGARLRARDDLTAPVVKFTTAAALQRTLRRCGLYVTRQVPTFREFRSPTVPEEFRPHEFLCGLNPDDEIDVSEPDRRYAADIRALRELLEAVLSVGPDAEVRKNLAIGLMNAHFSATEPEGEPQGAIRDLFLQLFYALKQLNVSVAGMRSLARGCVRMAEAAVAGESRGEKRRRITAAMRGLSLVDYLEKNTIRI